METVYIVLSKENSLPLNIDRPVDSNILFLPTQIFIIDSKRELIQLVQKYELSTDINSDCQLIKLYRILFPDKDCDPADCSNITYYEEIYEFGGFIVKSSNGYN